MSAEDEHLDVLIVGAGLSGVDAAFRMQSGSPGRRFAVFEARGAMGGTWDLFRYPGVRSDSDMATLGFPFRPWRGDKAIVEGGDIRAYIEDTAVHYGLDRWVRLNHRVVAADWSSRRSLWVVDYEAGGERRRLTCAFLFMCCGYYDYAQGHAPTWPGMETFAGEVVHPQFWPEGLDVAGRRVVVVGSGATAVTLVPALVRQGAAQVTMLQRSPTYIASIPSRDERAIWLRRRLPGALADRLVRWKSVALSLFFYGLARGRPETMKRMLAGVQKRMLGPEFDMAHLTPSYQPWDQRLCLVPDGDLFKALKSGRADIRTDRIARFTPAGLDLEDGGSLDADVVVSATGLKVKLMGGAELTVDGAPVRSGERLLYKGAMLDGVPNFAFAMGYTNASWTLKCDLTARFISRLLNHMARRGLAEVRPVAPEGAVAAEPMLGLKSGYVERAAALLPRQGRRAPWRVRQNYPLDFVALQLSGVADRALRFSGGPTPAAQERIAA